MRKILALILLSLGVPLITLYEILKPLGNGNAIETHRQVATPYLGKIFNLPCVFLSKSPNPFQNNYKPTPDSRERFRNPLRPINAVASFKSCGPRNLGVDELSLTDFEQPGNKQALLRSIDYSLGYLQTSEAAAAYQGYQVAEITRDRVFRSLWRFRQLVLSSASPEELEAAVKREFVFYQSVGKDGLGRVLFTAYFEPVYEASRVPTSEYRYPLYRRPAGLDSWPKPHPTRAQLEGIDGLQASKGPLRGLELFWLRSRLDAYQIHIQGSARLKLTDGTTTSVGYAGHTAHDYTSIGRSLADDGKLPLKGLKMPDIIRYFDQHPAELNIYIPRDESFVFFEENHGGPATGSVHVPLTGLRSIATDKSVMPPGALALIHAPFPFKNATGAIEYHLVSRYVLDQDTGGAIQGPGRVDYFLGTGKDAGDRAGLTVANGQLYYLLLKK